MPTIPFPLINGARFDFSSVEVKVGALVYRGVKEITYKWTLDPGMMRGTRAMVAGYSRGKYDVEGSITFFKSEYQLFIATLGPGYAEKYFPIVVHHSEAPALPIVTDFLNGCRLKSAENSLSEGEDVLVVKCDLLITSLLEGGLPALNPAQMLR